MAECVVQLAQEEEEPVAKSRRKALLRFFSVDSNINMCNVLTPETYNFCSREFLLKIAELVTGIICVGLYAKGVNITTESFPFACFPNVVFSSYIIITSVIIMSYMFGQVMPDVLIRAFTSIAMILYFISATISTTIWWSKKILKPDFNVELDKSLLLVQAVLSFVNCFLYGMDLFFNIKKAVTFEV